MTYDIFSFYNEVDMLDFRLHHVYDHVDYIVIVEGDRKYTGEQYQSNFLKNYDRFKWASSKIIHTIVPLKALPTSRWENEAIQRDNFLQDLTIWPDDIVFLSCVDEIIDTELYDLVQGDVTAVLHLDNYYYYFNGKDVGTNPIHPMPIVFNGVRNNLHQLWESRHSLMVIPDAGWHFSYVGGVDKIKEKLEAFSHSEYDNDEVKNALAKNIAEGKDIYGRDDHSFKYIKIDKSFPKELYDNQEKYKEFIHA